MKKVLLFWVTWMAMVAFATAEAVKWANEDEAAAQNQVAPAASGSALDASESSSEAYGEMARDESLPPRGGQGIIAVTTTPAKASVYLNSELIGKTPFEPLTYKSGRFDLTIMLGGNELVNERVNIWPGKTTALDYKLVMPFGTVILTTKPASANVMIDGADVARTKGGPLTINHIEAGTHILKVRENGWRSQETEITVKGEDTTRVEVKLGK